jgi:hypothetical protein
LCWFTHALLKLGFARRKVSLPPRVAREPSYNILSERMAYYSRYATGKKGLMLEFLMLQLVTSKLGAVAIPKAQPMQSLPGFTVFRHTLAASIDSHAPTCFSFADGAHSIPDHTLTSISTLKFPPQKMFPLDLVSRALYLLLWLVCRRICYSWTKRFIRSRYLGSLIDQGTLYQFSPLVSPHP